MSTQDPERNPAHDRPDEAQRAPGFIESLPDLDPRLAETSGPTEDKSPQLIDRVPGLDTEESGAISKEASIRKERRKVPITSTASVGASRRDFYPPVKGIERATDPTVGRLRFHTSANMEGRKPLETREDRGKTVEVIATYSTDENDPPHSVKAAIVRDGVGHYEVALHDGTSLDLSEVDNDRETVIVDLGQDRTFTVSYNKQRDELNINPRGRGEEVIETFSMFPPTSE